MKHKLIILLIALSMIAMLSIAAGEPPRPPHLIPRSPDCSAGVYDVSRCETAPPSPAAPVSPDDSHKPVKPVTIALSGVQWQMRPAFAPFFWWK